ncbi:hypothetical protein [Lacipirellula parvula]|uniref:Carboxypeptidase regulatory-like domain-containing protein n=1 Tax=Lacipirellula parvula TaxID=2650471 RepID=A0A5K7X5R2_9BACT|nr:hypothetical protein [Lacipirellula parvula]BBO31187.1 hypothetical protein PLANPX_0799 [Lacipirellula parvula]
MRFVSLLALIATFCWCTGCGGRSSTGNTAHLQGQVTIGGQPLPAGADGAITFRTTAGGAVTVPIAEGKYDSPATPRGAVKAYFSINKPTGKTYKSARTGTDVAETVSIVPASVSNGVEVEVSGDKADQNFDLGS